MNSLHRNTLWKKNLRYSSSRTRIRLGMATCPTSTILGTGYGNTTPWPRRPDCSVPSDCPATVRPVIQNIRRHAGHAVSDDHHQFVETNSLQRRSCIRRLSGTRSLLQRMFLLTGWATWNLSILDQLVAGMPVHLWPIFQLVYRTICFRKSWCDYRSLQMARVTLVKSRTGGRSASVLEML